MKLRGLVPNFLIHVSVSDLYIHRIGPLILLQQNRQTDRGRGHIVSFLGLYKSDLLCRVVGGRGERRGVPHCNPSDWLCGADGHLVRVPQLISLWGLHSRPQTHMMQNPVAGYILFDAQAVFFTETKISFMYSFLGIDRPQSQFPHSCLCERFLYSQDRSTYLASAK